MISQLAVLKASDGQAKDMFGFQVAMSGNTIVATSVGSQLHGKAYVFVEPAGGWADMTETAELTNSDGIAGDYFGDAVAISGNTILVGAYTATVGSNADQGAAYVFVMPTGGWTDMHETAKLTASDGQAEDGFGESVAIAGNTVAVGAINADGSKGAAYVYLKPANGWKTTSNFKAKLRASDGAVNDAFGYAVATTGTTVVAGAAQPPPSMGPGALYVFVEPAGGWSNMTQTAKLMASDGQSGDNLGASVAMNNNTIIAGAYLASIGSHASQGAAYVFVKPLSGWTNTTQTAKLIASDGIAGDSFGASVAISGNVIAIGAPGQQGKAYGYVKPGSGWRNTSHFNAEGSDGKADDFGFSLAISGNVEAVGTPLSTVSGVAFQGVTYVFGP